MNVRPAIPTDFDGDHGKGCAFFNMCYLYFTIIGDLFPNDQACIHWALFFFKSDCVAHFTNKVLRHKTKGKGVRALPWPDHFLFCLCFPYMDSLVVCPN